MKKLVLSLFLLSLAVAGFTQSEKYTRAMKEKIAALDTVRDATALTDLSAAFERIADAEKTQWHPYYYAALAQVRAALIMNMNKAAATETDPMADKAEQLLLKAEGMVKDNSEIYIVKKLIATAHMMGDPMNRYMKYGTAAQEALETARRLNPENPRVYLLEGQDKYFTPEQFGGSKEQAKQLFTEALKKYDSFQPAGDMDPVWGRGLTEYYLSLYK